MKFKILVLSGFHLFYSMATANVGLTKQMTARCIIQKQKKLESANRLILRRNQLIREQNLYEVLVLDDNHFFNLIDGHDEDLNCLQLIESTLSSD